MAESIHNYIPIRNLYYILCYAWNLAEQRDKLKVDAEHCDTYPDLFAKLLVAGCERMFRYGMYHEYVDVEEERYGVKGKLNIALSLKMGHWREGRLHCTHDEYSLDVLLNQIINASLRRLLAYKGLDPVNHNAVKSVYLHFPSVTEIELTQEAFNKVSINHNNRFYGLLIHICQLIYESLLPDQHTKGRYRFLDFSTDKMNRIFENFLLNFYKKECQQEYPNVDRSHIDFQLYPVDELTGDHLPTMETDVTMTNKNANRKIILDAKYYVETLVKRFEEGSKETIRREHISQVMSYVLNQEDSTLPYTYETNGILVYPQTKAPLCDTYRYRNTHHHLRVCTVNLDEDWQEIDKRLREIIRF